MSNDYTVSLQRYDDCRTVAKQRAATQWETFNFNMWNDYNNTLNLNWIDPWYETEPYTIDNDSPDYKQTVNMYYVYNWLKYKGYSDYAATAIISTMIHESSITGGAWEASNHPYSTLIGWDATQTNPNGAYYNNNWYRGGSAPAYANGSAKTWTAYFTDYSGYVWSKPAVAGSWDAVKEWPIKTERVMIEGVGLREMPVGYDSGILVFDTSVWKPDGRGYGLVQWTPWTKLPSMAAHFGSDASRHWQLNPTLQLMILEYQRERSAAGDSTVGEWTSNEATTAGFRINQSGYYFAYGQSCTWEQFASDSFIPWVESTCAAQEPPITGDDLEWAKRMTSMTIWVNCYEHAAANPYDYFGYNFPQITLYVISAIRYWDLTGYDVKDIPRARDIETCELDQYHVMPANILSYVSVRRRKKRNVRTLLL